MALIWTNHLRVGIEEFDEDHKRLLRYVNELSEAIHEGESKNCVAPEEIEIALHRLENYVLNHCTREEVLLEKTAYPQLAEHRAAHRGFLAEIRLMIVRFQGSNQPEDAKAIVKFIQDWIKHHIYEVDRAYSEHLHKHNIT